MADQDPPKKPSEQQPPVDLSHLRRRPDAPHPGGEGQASTPPPPPPRRPAAPPPPRPAPPTPGSRPTTNAPWLQPGGGQRQAPPPPGRSAAVPTSPPITSPAAPPMPIDKPEKVPELELLLADMIRRDASDLFLSAHANPKFSCQGDFIDALPYPLSPEEVREYCYSMMNEDQVAEFEEEMEINISYTVGEEGRFRVNIFTQRGTLASVIRRINVKIPTLQQLNLPEYLGKLLLRERGLILMTGATGSGKSTSLAAMIDYRNENLGGHIITIEDPVEFIHPNKKCLVNQREVGVDSKSFHIALKNTLRQAPKIIYIGEIRDAETMGFAIHASETGHLVLGTLHSNNANQTLERILNFFPHEEHAQLLLQLGLNLQAIISQRLVKKKGGGRLAALEILVNTPLIAELVTKGDISGIKTAMANSMEGGTQTFDQHLHTLWKAGGIDEEEAFRNADSANNLRLMMKGITGGGSA
ncbi:MAG: PilT/PilU family type 4a pilus ATPase [Candidatus Sumerlaeia bacterium]|nr:PilT/PilU family type 4a pilus ATPase [Candidatus Sumerlaeia bacterium]